MKQPTQSIDPQDAEAWEEALKGVKKLPETEEKPEAPLIIGEIRPTIDYRNVYRGNKLTPLKAGDVDNIDRRTADKFIRGEFKIERRLDLHGQTEKTAFDLVESFVKKSYLEGCRCVLIITGKGTRKENDDWFDVRGVLKDRVPQWLNTPELRPLILSFCHARPSDGGDGALYVLLRRKH